MCLSDKKLLLICLDVIMALLVCFFLKEPLEIDTKEFMKETLLQNASAEGG